jgi:NitT/TauT family transport system permease protein
MPWLALAILLMVWEIACIVFDVPEIILPRPTKVFAVFVAPLDILMTFCWDKLWTKVIGFLGSGGMLLGGRRLAAAVRPLSLLILNASKVAVPILISGSASALPAVTAVSASSRSWSTSPPASPPSSRRCRRAEHSAPPHRNPAQVGIPRAMPYLFASLKVAITLAFIGSVIAETVGGNNGIGFLMLSASARNDAPTTFAGLFAIAIMGVLMYAICAVVEKRMTRWAFRGEIVG